MLKVKEPQNPGFQSQQKLLQHQQQKKRHYRQEGEIRQESSMFFSWKHFITRPEREMVFPVLGDRGLPSGDPFADLIS